MTDDFFRSRLDQMIDSSHPLAVLASRLPWEKMQAGVAPRFAHQVLPLQQSEEAPDLAGPVVRVSGGKASNAGRPRLSTRLMFALTLLGKKRKTPPPNAAGSQPDPPFGR